MRFLPKVPKVADAITLRHRLLAAYLRQLGAEEGLAMDRLGAIEAMAVEFAVQADVATLLVEPSWAREFVDAPN